MNSEPHLGHDGHARLVPRSADRTGISHRAHGEGARQNSELIMESPGQDGPASPALAVNPIHGRPSSTQQTLTSRSPLAASAD
jgi:hypothetical protein